MDGRTGPRENPRDPADTEALRGMIARGLKTAIDFRYTCAQESGTGETRPTQSPAFRTTSFPAYFSFRPRQTKRVEWVTVNGRACQRQCSPCFICASQKMISAFRWPITLSIPFLYAICTYILYRPTTLDHILRIVSIKLQKKRWLHIFPFNEWLP